MLLGLQLSVLFVGEGWEDAPLGALFKARHRRLRRNFAELHGGACMADARGGAQEHRQLKFLGELEGLLHHFIGLFRRGRVQHRQVCVLCEVARVLLGLRGPGARIVCHCQHEAALDADVRKAHERVGRHVEPHLLHCHQRPRAGIRSSRRHLQRHLFVGRPLHADARRLLAHKGFDDLGGRRARIAGRDSDAGADSAQRNSFVSHTNPGCHIVSPPAGNKKEPCQRMTELLKLFRISSASSSLF